MAHGLPVVATDIAGSGVTWVNRNGVTGLNVPAGDARALAMALAGLVTNPERRARMGLAARRRFETEFTSALTSQRFMNLYCALTGRQVAATVS
jgi:glycosyltransferase involved in cell wall biosynthesis